MNATSESDWNTFRARVPGWRERYLTEANREIARLLSDPGHTPTERFWAAHDRAGEVSHVLRACFDGHSRRAMPLALTQMLSHGVVSDGDLGAFSDPLRERLEGSRPSGA